MTPDQVRGMLYGLAVGDALGVPVRVQGARDVPLRRHGRPWHA